MITSLSNERIKSIRKLRDRKYREETSQYFIEGTRIVFEALKTNQPVETIFYSPELCHNQVDIDLVAQAKNQSIEIIDTTRDVYLSVSQKEGSQGIGAVCRQRWTDLNPMAMNGVWIALYEIADPGNLGTIMRTADATGTKGIILIGHCTDPYDPAALRASMGGIYSLDLVKADANSFVVSVAKNVPVIGTSDSAEIKFHTVTYPADLVLLMGSEREGLPPQLQSVCRNLVSIPMVGSCDSLNLSVSTGIILYEILNQHQGKTVIR